MTEETRAHLLTVARNLWHNKYPEFNVICIHSCVIGIARKTATAKVREEINQLLGKHYYENKSPLRKLYLLEDGGLKDSQRSGAIALLRYLEGKESPWKFSREDFFRYWFEPKAFKTFSVEPTV